MISTIISVIPYDPSVDLADATTNDIWIEHYSEGVYHIPYDDWKAVYDYPVTQSVVVEHDGEYVVVNEKGPGHVMMMIPFHQLGLEFIFAPLMLAFAVFSTYMLGKRLFSWRAGFIAGLLVLTNVTVLVMAYRYYWTDASTMHLLVLSAWLMIESNYWLNGKSLKYAGGGDVEKSHLILGLVFGVLSGLAFGAAVSTRYATALILGAMLFYLAVFYFIRVWPDLKKMDIAGSVRKAIPLFLILAVFAIGLAAVLLPLMNYNTEYFGSPFASGYDQILLNKFEPMDGLSSRNTSASWSSSFGDMISTSAGNLITLLPLLIARMPALLLLPLGFWLVRKRPEHWFIFLWAGINFFTYLAISWVDFYASLPPGTLHETRYWMPAVPAIGLLGGLAIDRFSGWLGKRIGGHEKKILNRRVLAAAFITGILVLAGLVPALGYFSHQEEGGGLSPRGYPQQVIVVTTDQLLDNPMGFRDRLVRVENATIIDIDRDIFMIKSPNSQNQGTVMALWPPGEAPPASIGEIIDVGGIYILGQTPYGDSGFFIAPPRDLADGQPPPPP